VLALGASWAIDGLEVTLTGAVSGVLQDPATLHFSGGEIGAIASFYLYGAVVGSCWPPLVSSHGLESTLSGLRSSALLRRCLPTCSASGGQRRPPT
jgi:hypothetical protein